MKKHPLHIRDFAHARPHKRLSPEAPRPLGFDIETDHTTGSPRLMHDSDGRRIFEPRDTPAQRAKKVFRWARNASFDKRVLVCWRQFDIIQLFRVLWETLEPADQDAASAAWEKLQPCISVTVYQSRKPWKFALSKFKGGARLSWATGDARGFSLPVVDSSKFYRGSLETVCADQGISYAKGAKELHLVDWERYGTDAVFRARVDASNKLDASVAAALYAVTHRAFHGAFGVWAGVMTSAGGMAKSALAALLPDTEYKRVAWTNAGFADPAGVADTLWLMASEAYSGGYIDAFVLGSPRGETWIADIASAYPGAMLTMPDFSGAALSTGTGQPPETGPFDVVIGRARLTVPRNSYHSVCWDSGNGTKSRPHGTFTATLFAEEAAWVLAIGGKVEWVNWVLLKCDGLSPVARAADALLVMRGRHKGTTMDLAIKESAASLYGIQVETNIEYGLAEGKITKTSLKAGELYNPVAGAYITAMSRLRLAHGCHAIEQRGGKPLMVMTDSILWEGPRDALPVDMGAGRSRTGIREAKTAGYFEAPERLRNVLIMGPGRYEYSTDHRGHRHVTTKARGYRLPDGADGLRLRAALSKACRAGATVLSLPTSVLWSPSLASARTGSREKIGLVETIPEKTLDPYSLSGKRDVRNLGLSALLARAVATRQTYVDGGDNTLPELRGRFLRARDNTRRAVASAKRRAPAASVGRRAAGARVGYGPEATARAEAAVEAAKGAEAAAIAEARARAEAAVEAAKGAKAAAIAAAKAAKAAAIAEARARYADRAWERNG